MTYKRKNLDKASGKAVNTEQRAGEWLIHSGGYDGDRTAYGELYAVAQTGPYGMVNTGDLIHYRPLVDHPDLFLKFARLKLDIPGTIYWSEYLTDYPFVFGEYDYTKLETERNVKVALDWADENGVLGLTRGRPPR